MRLAVSWSGGKDSALAMARAVEAGHEVAWLLNFVDPVSGRDRAHGLRDSILRAQAEALGVPMVQRDASWESYELQFRRAVRALKKEGLEGVAFGDVSLAQHREWGERVCGEVGVAAVFPLWGEPHHRVVEEFQLRGFRGVVVAVNAPLGEKWLGRWIDDAFLPDLKREAGVSPAGEGGEYHTLVTGGPLFRKPLDVCLGEGFELGHARAVDVTLGVRD